MVTIAEARIGTGGTMFIDDDGTYIRWYLKQDDPQTAVYAPGKPWGVTINGQDIGGNFTWAPGTAGAIRLIAGPAAATYDQVVAFTVGATGTQGFGNGGTIFGTVNRATVPSAPSAPSFSNVTHNAMRLAWTLGGNGGAAIDQVVLHRSTSPSFDSYTNIALAANATSYNATGLTPDTLYYWRVFTHNSRGFSPASPAASRRTASAPDAPGTPSSSEITASSVKLTWTLPDDGGMPLTEILLRRSTTADFASFTDTVLAANATTATVTNLPPGTTHYWRVYARNVVGYGPASGARQATTLGTGAPTLAVTRTDTTSTATLSRSSDATGFSNYTLQRRPIGSTFVSSTDSATSPIVSTGLVATTRYEWRASAVYGSYRTPWTAWVSTPAAPSTPVASEVTPTSMRLSWTRPTDVGGSAITQMVLRRSTEPDFASFTDIPLGATATSTVVTALTPGTAYYWRAFARNAVGYSLPSSSLSQSTLPGSAPGLTVTAAVSGTSSTAVITPPGGASGYTKFTLQRRIVGQATVTTLESATSPITSTSLNPGTRYEYRASAWFGTYQSPWTSWIALTQPNPNTDPGAYFDGNTADTSVTTYDWTGTVNNSTTTATAVVPTGWLTFTGWAGGTGAIFRASGGARGSYCARAIFFTDATAAGFQFGVGSNSSEQAEVGENVEYVGSIYVWPSKIQRLRAVIRWYTEAGVFVSASVGVASSVPTGKYSRLTITATSPVGARRAAVVVQDVAGTDWSLWQGGDWIQADAAMLSVQTLYPYFDGNTADTSQYAYEWIAAANASASLRRDVPQAEIDALRDPDCDPIPGAPQPPQIETSCVDEIGTWRRYWAVIPEEEVYDWLSVVPTLTITTGAAAARQVRIRFYQNPLDLAPSEASALPIESEQVITYIPPRTVITLDGVSESVWAAVNGGADESADHLLVGSNGAPAQWPVLSCGSAYLVSFDTPLDAPVGNVVIGASLTMRTM